MLAHRWLKGHVQWEVSFWLSGLEMKYLRQCLLGLAGSPTVKGEEEGMGGGDGRRGWVVLTAEPIIKFADPLAG